MVQDRSSGSTVPAALMSEGDRRAQPQVPSPNASVSKPPNPSSPRGTPDAGLPLSRELQPPAGRQGGPPPPPTGPGPPALDTGGLWPPSVPSAPTLPAEPRLRGVSVWGPVFTVPGEVPRAEAMGGSPASSFVPGCLPPLRPEPAHRPSGNLSYHTNARAICFQKHVSPCDGRGSFCWGAVRSVSGEDGPAPKVDRPSHCLHGGRAVRSVSREDRPASKVDRPSRCLHGGRAIRSVSREDGPAPPPEPQPSLTGPRPGPAPPCCLPLCSHC